MSNPKVSIIIPHYSEDKEYLHLCVDSLMKQTYQNVEIIVSSSSRVTPIGLHPSVRLYQSQERMHYAQAINKGVDIAINKNMIQDGQGGWISDPLKSPKYLILGNDDTIYSKTAIEDMIDVAGDQDIILNCISNCDNGVLFAKRKKPFSVTKDNVTLMLRNSMSLEEVRGFESALMGYPQGDIDFIPSHLNFVCFYATLIPVQTWLKLGILDEQFVTAGFEDADLCFRAKQQGIAVGFTTRSFIFHFSGKTSSKVTTDEERASNREKFNKKWNIV